MKLLLPVEIGITNPNIVGEYFRDWFFDQRKGIGCYQTFELNKRNDIKELPAEPGADGEMWQCAEYFNDALMGRVKCLWYWDGDGTLAFYFADESSLHNFDCKKDNRWEWIVNA